MWSRWNDIDRMFNAMDLLQSRMNRIFSEAGVRSFPPVWGAIESGPRANLYDVGDHLEIMTEVPGIPKAELNVRIQGNYLEISGGRKDKAPEGYTAHRVERGSNSFTRSFTLPADVNSEKVEASLKNGILKLMLPKAEISKPRQIAIN